MKALVVLLVLGTALPVWGQTARRPLAWEYERALIPPVKAFGLAAVDSRGGIQQFQVPPSEPGACEWAENATATTFCTTVPCPSAGLVTAYWVQALTANESSPPSNILICWTPPSTSGCPCLDPSSAPPGQGLPPAPPPIVVAPPAPPVPPPPLSTEVPPLPQQGPEGLPLHPLGPVPTLASMPAIPASGGT